MYQAGLPQVGRPPPSLRTHTRAPHGWDGWDGAIVSTRIVCRLLRSTAWEGTGRMPHASIPVVLAVPPRFPAFVGVQNLSCDDRAHRTAHAIRTRRAQPGQRRPHRGLATDRRTTVGVAGGELSRELPLCRRHQLHAYARGVGRAARGSAPPDGLNEEGQTPSQRRAVALRRVVTRSASASHRPPHPANGWWEGLRRGRGHHHGVRRHAVPRVPGGSARHGRSRDDAAGTHEAARPRAGVSPSPVIWRHAVPHRPPHAPVERRVHADRTRVSEAHHLGAGGRTFLGDGQRWYREVEHTLLPTIAKDAGPFAARFVEPIVYSMPYVQVLPPLAAGRNPNLRRKSARCGVARGTGLEGVARQRIRIVVV